MIYVLVEESGEYSSYNKDNIFASLSRDVIEAKLAEYEKIAASREQIAKEYYELAGEWNRLHPYPKNTHKRDYDKYSEMKNTWIKSTIEELGKKHNIPSLDLNYILYGKHWYSIEEVESD